ncbi:MAG: amino acid racemase [Pseudomonadota bacterium]
MQHIGIVGGSAEGAALCYRTICTEAEAKMGEHNHPEVSLHTYALAEYMRHIDRDDWDGVAYLMSRSATKLADIGAEFAICPDNTFHQAFDKAAEASPIPWLHIAAEVAREAVARGYRKLGVTGTAYLMAGPVYPQHLGQAGLDMVLPDEADREVINTTIFKRLVKGQFDDADRARFTEIFAKLRGAGCDAVVMGCTEIPLLMDGVETPLPTLDSTRLLARAALRHAES